MPIKRPEKKRKTKYNKEEKTIEYRKERVPVNDPIQKT